MKRFVAAILSFVLCFCFSPTAFASSWNFTISGNTLISYEGTAKSIAVPDGVNVIGNGAFQHCEELEVVVLHEGVTVIGSGAFNGCTNLELIVIPSTVHTIGQEAFSGTPWLKSQGDVVIVNDIFVAYQGTDETFEVPDGVRDILPLAFAWRTSLKRVTIPSSVTTIGSAAFLGCSNLAEVNIPSTLSRVGGNVFGSTNLITINYEGTRSQWESISVGDYNDVLNNATINYNYKAEIIPEILPNVMTSSWATNSVSEAIALGIVPSSKLQNDYTQAISREQFCDIAVIVYESLAGCSIQNYKQANTFFSDTESENVRKMASLGVVNGCGDIDGDGSPDFAPSAFITREQAASILARLIESLGIKLTEGQTPFNDNISSWARANVAKMYCSGIMNGYSNTEFGANGTYTIEQSITTMLRTFKYVQSMTLPIGPSSNPENNSTPSTPSNSEVIIYITKTGFRYHYDSTCNGGTYYESTLNDAVRRGLSPCEKCAMH